METSGLLLTACASRLP